MKIFISPKLVDCTKWRIDEYNFFARLFERILYGSKTWTRNRANLKTWVIMHGCDYKWQKLQVLYLIFFIIIRFFSCPIYQVWWNKDFHKWERVPKRKAKYLTVNSSIDLFPAIFLLTKTCWLCAKISCSALKLYTYMYLYFAVKRQLQHTKKK